LLLSLTSRAQDTETAIPISGSAAPFTFSAAEGVPLGVATNADGVVPPTITLLPDESIEGLEAASAAEQGLVVGVAALPGVSVQAESTNSSEVVLLSVSQSSPDAVAAATRLALRLSPGGNLIQPLYSIGSCIRPGAGLVGWWRAETNSNDSAGTNNATTTNGISYVAGEVGQAFSFNGGQSVKVPYASGLMSTGFTIEVWVKPQQLSSQAFCVGQAYGRQLVLLPGSGGNVNAVMYLSTTNGSFVGTTNVSIPVGQYTHLAATYDEAYLKLYTNGVLARSSAYSAPLGDSFCAWGFGGLISTCGFSGQYLPYGSQIDEVSLYNRALLAGEINAIYLAGAAGKCTTLQSCTCTPTNAVASWPGEGDASDMFNNYPGTLQNGVGFDQGVVARAFTLNPTNQQAVEMPSLSWLLTSPFSIEAWIKPLSQLGGSPHQAFILGQSYGSQLVVTNGLLGLRVGFVLASSRTLFHELVSSGDIPLEEWSHLVAVYDGTAMSLYVNGALDQQAAANITPWDSGCPFHLGGVYDSSGTCAYTGQFFNGLIDEATVYSQALSASDVQALYNAGEAGKCYSLGYWLEYYFGPNCWNEPYATAAADADGDGTNNFQEFLNHTDPNKIQFSLSFTNLYVTNTAVPAQLSIIGGVPFYMEVLVNSTNISSTNWQAFTGTNLNVNLGTTDGFYEVRAGLKGLPVDAQQTWEWVRLKLDRTPPQLLITGPTNSTVTVPLLQLTGYSPEALSSLTYAISNAAGIATGLQAVITGQVYNTNTAEFTTNYFQCYDVSLTNGLNVITLQATDLAGNMTTLATNIVCSPTTNPPAVALIWPQAGMQICGGSISIQGRVNDPTAAASVAVADGSGNTNYFTGLVGRDGIFWIENVALNTGTSSLALTLSNPAGSTTTNFTLIQSTIGLSVDAVQPGDTTVGGTIGTSGYTIWVNGVQASQDSGRWTAQIAPVGVNGGLVAVTACPGSGPSLNTQATVEAPQGVFVSAYHHNQQTDVFIRESGGVVPQHYSDTLDWQDGQGGTNLLSGYEDFYFQIPTLFDTEWPATRWPQAFTNGAETQIYWNDFVSPPYVTTNTSIAGAPDLAQVHCDVNQTPCGGPNVRRTEDAEIMLATGGPLGSTQQNMWMISAGATDAATGLPIPYDELYVGGFGNPDTNGNLVIMLPDNDPAGITVRAPGHDNYSFGATARKYNLLITCESPCPTNTHRLTIGVGELVDISLDPPLPPLAPPYDADSLITWHTTAGSLSKWHGNTTVLTAPSNATMATVTMNYYGVTHVKYVTNFTVIEPANVVRAVTVGRSYFDIGQSGAGMHITPYVGPTNVSFYRVQLMEVGQDASSIRGYFSQWTPQQLAHNDARHANQWFQLGPDNTWPSGYDWATSDVYLQPWSAGGFTWIIPAKWKIGSGQTNDLANGWTQVYTIDAAGTVTITKFQHVVTRHTTENYGTVVPDP
jgi:hypothetical protein